MDCACLRAFVPPLVVLATFMALSARTAGAQSPLPMPRVASGDLILDAARAAFEALPEADRKAVQDALIWTGDYSGAADGTFGRQTYSALAAFQTRTRQQPNGILTPQALANLQAVAQQARIAAGFTLLEDPKTGIRIAIPTKVLPKQDLNSSGGSRWQSQDGRVTLDTRTAPPDATLQSLYDRNLAIQTPGRVVSYKVLRPDFFVIAGETQTGKFYTRYSSGPAGLRGFSIGYDKILSPQIDRLVVAIANSFTPFPSAPATVAAPQSPAPALAPQPQLQPPARNLIGTGLVIGRRQVVTAAPVAACVTVSVMGLKPQRITGRNVIVLEFAEDLKAKPIAPFQGTPEEDMPVLVVAFMEDGSAPSLSAAPGRLSAPGLLSAALQPGASGAPILDRQGALVGLVGGVSPDQRRIAGIVPAGSYPLVPAADLAKAVPAFAAAATEPAAPARSAADIVAVLRPALVPIQCGP